MEQAEFAVIAGWIPAIILPLASGTQLLKLFRTQNAEGVSPLSWLLFALANIGAYFFTEKYFSFQAISAFLVTAVLNSTIALRAAVLQSKNK